MSEAESGGSDASWISGIPDGLIASLGPHPVVEYGFRAGASFIAGQTWKGPCSLADAIEHLSGFAGTARRAHIALDDGRTFWFEPPNGFYQVTTKGSASPLDG